MTGEGRIVPPHASGPGEEARQKPRAPFAYPGRNPYASDPDETDGRKLYRGLANAEARRAMGMARHVRLLASGTSGSAQDRNELDPKGAGPTAEGGDAQTLPDKAACLARFRLPPL